MILGLDTSNYTTSVAYFDGQDYKNCSQLLAVKPGELGLRQSDALFAHVKNLPGLFAQLECPGEIQAIGVSTRPRAVEGSYMPCFLAGISQAQVLSTTLGVPLFEVSHQQGHVAAALFSSGRMDLMDKPHLAWHLSGGTTELLLVEPEGKNVKATKIGGTTDISAGQVVDRTAKQLNLGFPGGKALDALAQNSQSKDKFSVKVKEDLTFSLSGLENKVADYGKDHNPEDVAKYALLSVISAVERTTKLAKKKYPGLEVVLSGGVAANSLMRERIEAVYALPQFSTDNALGVAILATRLMIND